MPELYELVEKVLRSYNLASIEISYEVLPEIIFADCVRAHAFGVKLEGKDDRP